MKPTSDLEAPRTTVSKLAAPEDERSKKKKEKKKKKTKVEITNGALKVSTPFRGRFHGFPRT